MKAKYIELMEKALSAYTDEHIRKYFDEVKTNGLTEHGFPRLTSNIGILIAHGRRGDLLPIFIEMMDFCCDQIPKVKAANDFSVREIVCCIDELERAKAVDEERILRWKQKISQIVPEACYTVLVKGETDRITNWAIFGAVSEYARVRFGLGENFDFIDRQLSCQFQWLDENGMYRDNPKEIPHQPIMYDLVSRGLFALLIHFGYRGTYYEKIDACLKRAGLFTLKMQSPNGEMAFGGRSNQFLHNEAWMIAVFEYEANRYVAEGNLALAKRFKAASARALAVTEDWLSRTPIRHIKNRFPTGTKYGCEGYAYFDKYMITVASNLYAAYLICDDSIPTEEIPDVSPTVAQTSSHFHKLFLKSGGYGLEYDTNGDPQYDASGLGRVHRKGAPSTICLSCPCPATPIYTVDIEKPFAFSMCSAIREGDGWHFGAEEGAKYEVLESGNDKDSASATILCKLTEDRVVKESYTINENGVSIIIKGDGEIGYMLPAFCFDGEITPEIIADDHSLTVSYEGWVCRYTTNGTIINLNRMAANRNGHYQAFLAIGEEEIHVNIELIKQK